MSQVSSTWFLPLSPSLRRCWQLSNNFGVFLVKKVQKLRVSFRVSFYNLIILGFPRPPPHHNNGYSRENLRHREGDRQNPKEQGDRIPLGLAEGQTRQVPIAVVRAAKERRQGRRIRCAEVGRCARGAYRFPVGRQVDTVIDADEDGE